MQWFFNIVIGVSPLLIGLGYFKFHWIAVPVIAAYLSSILLVGEIVGDDFNNPHGANKMGAQKSVSAATFGTIVIIAVIYGIGKLIAWMFLGDVEPLY